MKNPIGWLFLAPVLAYFCALAASVLTGRRSRRLEAPAQAVLAVFLAVSIAVLARRFWSGLGSITAMTDRFPWGVWIGLLQSGVALAAGGFVTAATVHIFHLKRFEPVLRPMVLTAFLGYLFVALTLVVEVGRPQNLWHPLVMWQHHSIMFEVAWCVTLYMTVLLVEFSPAVFERLGNARAARALHAAATPVVIAGVILSVLHQSSMGSMFLVMPQKIHPLWFSPLLPVLFLVSAVAAGLCAVIIESFFSYRLFGRGLEMALLEALAVAARNVLFLYSALRLLDVTLRGAWPDAASPLGALFALELGAGFVLPAVLFSLRSVRERAELLAAASLCAAGGVVLNRLSVSWFSLVPYTRTDYFPAWSELTVSIFFVTLTVLLFGWAVVHLPVFAGGPVGSRRP